MFLGGGVDHRLGAGAGAWIGWSGAGLVRRWGRNAGNAGLPFGRLAVGNQGQDELRIKRNAISLGVRC
jgi:hypothetical protein